MSAAQRTAVIEVAANGVVRASRAVAVAEAAPGVFTMEGGSGQAVAVYPGGELNSAANPAGRGAFLTIYVTGEGRMDPPRPVTVNAGGYSAEVSYAGPAPGFVGVMQVNFRVPGGFLPSGALQCVVKVGDWATQRGVTIAVQ